MDLFITLAVVYLVLGLIVTLIVFGALFSSGNASIKYRGQEAYGYRRGFAILMLFLMAVIVWPYIIGQNI
jgi:hypothetical protein